MYKLIFSPLYYSSSAHELFPAYVSCFYEHVTVGPGMKALLIPSSRIHSLCAWNFSTFFVLFGVVDTCYIFVKHFCMPLWACLIEGHHILLCSFCRFRFQFESYTNETPLYTQPECSETSGSLSPQILLPSTEVDDKCTKAFLS